MNNTKAYLTYALNKNGELVHIDNVPNGNDCACFCPHCNSELCAKNGGSGTKMVHHFAHVSGADCVGAIESALHKMAKDVMKETLCIQLPDRLDGSHSELLKLDRVEVEFYDKETNLRPDCIGYYGDKVIWIEFKRTHAVDTKKKGKIISANINCVELDLNVCVLNPEAVRNFIINDRNNRVWIRDTEAKTRTARKSAEHGYYYDKYEYRHVERVFAKDEKGKLVNLMDDKVDMNAHNYYCLACGNELTLDISESGSYIFEHLDNSFKCEDDLYLHEAAKDIIKYKFDNNNEFKILVPQNQNCIEKTNCIFYQPERCYKVKGISYDLKQHGYIKCLKNHKLPDFKYKCDLAIITADIKVENNTDSNKNAIIININAGSCHVEKGIKEYRVIDLKVLNSNSLLSLLNKPIEGYDLSSKFKRENKETVSRTEVDRGILKFSLYSSGKYYINRVPCSKVYEYKHSTILEHIFIDEIQDYNAKLYSLMRCYEQKHKVCLCEICQFLDKITNFNNRPQTICKRYKTTGTPHYPLTEMPIDCPYFKIDKEIEKMVKLNYNNVKVIEKNII